MVVVFLEPQLLHGQFDLLVLAEVVGEGRHTVCNSNQILAGYIAVLLPLQTGNPVFEMADAFRSVLVKVAGSGRQEDGGTGFIISRFAAEQADPVFAAHNKLVTGTAPAPPVANRFCMARGVFGEDDDVMGGSDKG